MHSTRVSPTADYETLNAGCGFNHPETFQLARLQISTLQSSLM